MQLFNDRSIRKNNNNNFVWIFILYDITKLVSSIIRNNKIVNKILY